MTLFQLHLAAEIERTGSITAAAAILNVSQPNASTSLKRLEAELGCVLFERSGNSFVPTEHGVLFLEHAKRIIREDTAMRSVCKMESIARLRLGVMNYTPANEAFVRLCIEKKDLPLADYSCVAVNFDEAQQLLKERAIDIAVCFLVKAGIERTTMLCSEEDMELKIIRDIPISIRIRKDHPLAEILLNEPVLDNMKKLSSYPYVEYSNISNLLQVYNSESSHYFGCSHKILVSTSEMRLKLVGSTDAYSIGTHLPKGRCEQNNIVSIPIGEEASCIVSLMRKDSVVTDDITRYLELLNEELDKQND